MEISKKEFLLLQPGYPETSESDDFYYSIVLSLIDTLHDSNILKKYGENITKEIILSITGYYQDIVADSGIWRSFCTTHYELYNRLIPFYEINDDYIESELNLVDIKFLVWYIIECSLEENGNISPFDNDIDEAANRIFEVLDLNYDDAPISPDYQTFSELDIHDEEQIHEIYDFSYWLFWNSYFMKHAASPTMRSTLAEGREIVKRHQNIDEARNLLQDLNQRTMKEYPTGPLSLYIHEWLAPITENKSPFRKAKHSAEKETHKYYSLFMKANKNVPIKFIANYSTLNMFLSKDMNWGNADKDGHLPQFKDFSNFILYVSPQKGLLIAPDIAQYVCHPTNPLYNEQDAKENAYSLITVQGRCPIDLIKYLFSNNLVPDAAFKWDNSKNILLDNWDFLARLYLQNYYRAN
ncbi:MAG: DUF3843 family protein [Muribaculaceae bacterium]|nr:DUF3843 family protein [Muribaculaceae bacterium]